MKSFKYNRAVMLGAYDKSVLFVCMGNICRSPIAEAVMNHVLKEAGLAGRWIVDSAGTYPWHVGNPPDPRAQSVLRSHHMVSSHIARQVKPSDFDIFDYILAMDEENICDIDRIKPKNTKAVIDLLGSYDPAGDIIIDDPFYTQGEKLFQKTMDHIRRSCEGFLKSLSAGD